MNKQKLSYLSPETETLVVRFEGVVCTSPLQTLGLLSGGGDGNSFGDTKAEVQDLSSGQDWW